MHPPDRHASLARERRQQVAGALLLGGLILLAAVLRYGVHNLLPAGWGHAR